MHLFRQISAVTALNMRSLPSRLRTSLVIVVGLACVVGVLLSMLAYTTGLESSFRAAGDPGRAIVVTKGAGNEYNQLITRAMFATIQEAPGIARDSDGKAIASGEHLTNVPIRRKGDQVRSNVVFRGLGEKGFLLRPDFRLVSGRMFQPGTNELIAGAGAAAQFEGLELGDTVRVRSSLWKVVGTFTTGGDMIESQLLAEVDTKLAAVERNGFGSVIVRLESPEAFDAFRDAVTSNPTLNVDVERQSDFYARTTGQFIGFLSALAYVLGVIMAFGALFGTVNIMYLAVASRTREIATLRALGFGAAPVAVSVVAEALLLAFAGALLGAGIAWTLFNGDAAVQGTNVFRLTVTPGLVAIGLVFALIIAFAGGLFPAIRAARLPVTTALRSA